jgi:VanZ family protein
MFLLAIVAFIIYGSLFPFDFVTDGLPLERFLAEDHIFGNRVDAIDNFFLFLPLGVSLYLAFRPGWARWTAAALSVLLLAIGIQVLQLYLPSRVASLSDAFWNTVGMGAGLLVATRVRRTVGAQISTLPAQRDSFLVLLVLLWFVYESFPFVPTLDVGLLREHVKSAVYAPQFELLRLAQHGMAAALAGVAIARAGLLRRPLYGLIGAGALALALEITVAYGSLRRETMLGIVLGLACGYLLARRLPQHAPVGAAMLALAAMLMALLLPYRGQALDHGFTWTPFSHVLWRGVVNDVPPMAFEALAIGTLLWAGLAGRRPLCARPLLWCLLVASVLALSETMRAGLIGIHGDTTPLAMALVLIPAAVGLRQRDSEPVLAVPLSPAPAPAVAPTPSLGVAGLAGAFVACAAIGMWLVTQLPGVPYNLAKLFGEQRLLGAALFALALLWIGGGAWLPVRYVMVRQAAGRSTVLLWPLCLAGLALVAFALVNAAVPTIMLDKIIGAPDLYRRVVDENYLGDAWRSAFLPWPAPLVQWGERSVRFVALYTLFLAPVLFGLLALDPAGRRPRLVIGALCLLPCWLLAKLVVLDWAITDNLTELVADYGTVYLGLLLLLFGAHAAVLVGYRRYGRTVPVLLLATVVLLTATWQLLNLGVESVVINNGRVFSGVQFLLGQDRSTLSMGPGLFLRWCALYGAALAVTVGGALLARRGWPLPARAR